MPSKQAQVTVLEVDPDGPNKGGFYRYKATWTNSAGERMTEWVSSKGGGLRRDGTYECEMSRAKKTQGNGFWYTISGARPVGDAAPEPAPAAQPSVTVRPLAELRLAARFVNCLRENMTLAGEGGIPRPADPSTLNTVLAEMFRRGTVDRYIAEQTQTEQRQSERHGPDVDYPPDVGPDELPPDDDIPF